MLYGAVFTVPFIYRLCIRFIDEGIRLVWKSVILSPWYWSRHMEWLYWYWSRDPVRSHVERICRKNYWRISGPYMGPVHKTAAQCYKPECLNICRFGIDNRYSGFLLPNESQISMNSLKYLLQIEYRCAGRIMYTRVSSIHFYMKIYRLLSMLREITRSVNDTIHHVTYHGVTSRIYVIKIGLISMVLFKLNCSP